MLPYKRYMGIAYKYIVGACFNVVHHACHHAVDAIVSIARNVRLQCDRIECHEMLSLDLMH